MNDVRQRMEFLEWRFRDLYIEARLARTDLETNEAIDSEGRLALKRWLDATEREQQAILREIESLERSLPEDIDVVHTASEA
jgi:hypothetical protein